MLYSKLVSLIAYLMHGVYCFFCLCSGWIFNFQIVISSENLLSTMVWGCVVLFVVGGGVVMSIVKNNVSF